MKEFLKSLNEYQVWALIVFCIMIIYAFIKEILIKIEEKISNRNNQNK